MKATELAKYLQQEARWNINGVKVDVLICDVRQVFDRLDFEILPLKGENSCWVSSASVELLKAVK